MSQIVRPLVALLSLVALWFLAMILEALRVPAWGMAIMAGVLLVNLVVLVASLHQVTREQSGRPGDGGIRTDNPDLPEPGGGGEPSWWPEFERELAQYLAERDEQARQPELVPARLRSLSLS